MFRRLRTAAAVDWDAYCWHPFVRGLAEGTLPPAAFRRYLVQDYLFLLHFARAEALALVKCEGPAAMREKAGVIAAILDETALHLGYCASWGLDAAAVEREPEAAETVAYTRWVMDRGLSGDILDLEVALAPCTVGYGEIALRIAAHPGWRREGNPYESWIAMYSGDEYQALAAGAAVRLDALGESHGGQARFAFLAEGFRTAARLEAAFWAMGLAAG